MRSAILRTRWMPRPPARRASIGASTSTGAAAVGSNGGAASIIRRVTSAPSRPRRISTSLVARGLPWYAAPFRDILGIVRGRTIYFRPGVCDTATVQGLALLAHELVHVGQYRSGMTAWRYLLELAWRGYRRHHREIPAHALE